MQIDLAALPDDVATLQRMIGEMKVALDTERSEAQAEIDRLRQIVKTLQRSQFGRRAERLDDDQMQLGLEDLGADIARQEAVVQRMATPRMEPEQADARSSLPPHLVRTEMVVDLETVGCPSCGAAVHEIGDTVSEMLDYVPARLRVIRTRRPRYGCRACGIIHQATAPERPIAKGLASPGLLAHVPVSRYADHLPLYRQAQIFARQGVSLSRSTLANWVGGAAWWLEALHTRLAEQGCSPRPSCPPTTRRSRCSTLAAAAPRPVDYGSMPAMIDHGPAPIRRRHSSSTVRIAGPNIPRPT